MFQCSATNMFVNIPPLNSYNLSVINDIPNICTGPKVHSVCRQCNRLMVQVQLGIFATLLVAYIWQDRNCAMMAQTVYKITIWGGGYFLTPPRQTNKSNWGVEEMNWGGGWTPQPPSNSHTECYLCNVQCRQVQLLSRGYSIQYIQYRMQCHILPVYVRSIALYDAPIFCRIN